MSQIRIRFRWRIPGAVPADDDGADEGGYGASDVASAIAS